MIDLAYLIGQPGSGKTTLTRAVFEGVEAEAIKKPVPHIRYPGGAQIGADREKFGGTDALHMAIQPEVIPWMLSSGITSFFAEGDRLANDKFVMDCAAAKIRFHLICLWVPDSVGVIRRMGRSSIQSPVWVKGRGTKVKRLWANYGHPRWKLDGRKRVDELVNDLCSHPVIQKIIHGGRSDG